MVEHRQRVFELVRAQIISILPGVAAEDIREDDTAIRMVDLGANSVDRTDVLINCMESLGIRMPLHEARGLGTIRELVEFLARHSTPTPGRQ